MKTELTLNLPILPESGIGELKLGIHAREILPLVQSLPFREVRVQAWHWRLYEYILWESITLGVDIFSGRLSQIEVHNQYQGKLDGKIGIGSTVRELTNWWPGLEIEEFRIMRSDGKIIFHTDFDDDIESLDQVANNRIERIQLRIPGWQQQ